MNIEEKIRKIEERNRKVELDKAWETSWTRKIAIMVLTYLVVVAYSFAVKEINHVLLNSLVPVFGFFLSTLSVDALRKLWEAGRKK